MLTGDDGILTRAGEVKYSKSISQFDEKTKLAYLTIETEIKANKASKSEYIATTNENFTALANQVANELGTTAIQAGLSAMGINNEGFTVAYYLEIEGNSTQNGEGYIVIWYTDNSLRSIMDRGDIISKNGFIDVASNKSVNQITLVDIIRIKNDNGEFSKIGLTSTTDSNGDGTEYNIGDEKQIYFAATTLNDKLGFKSSVEPPQDRTGIKVGDYVKYIAPERDGYIVTSAISGYSGPQTFRQQCQYWRVMNINPDKSMDLVAATLSSNYLYLKNAVGYNNGVLILNDMCKYLYQNEEKGITARSLKYEDITDKMVTDINGRGIKKIEAYQTSIVNSLSTGSYITAVDKKNNLVTYVKARSYYPDIYEHQYGAGINTTNVLQQGEEGVIGESDEYYEKPTTKTCKQASNKLTVKFTFYSGTIAQNDFKDFSNNTSLFYKSIFETERNFWLASRYVYANQYVADFGLRCIKSKKIDGSFDRNLDLFYSNYDSTNSGYSFAPVISLRPNVKVEIKTGTNSSNAHEVKY